MKESYLKHTANICQSIFVFSLLTVLSVGKVSSQIGLNEDGWNFAIPIEEKCFTSASTGLPVGQVDANFCMADAFHVADKELNEKYKRLASVLFEGKVLQESQREWIKFRDLECKLRTSGRSQGSGTQFAMDSCSLDLTLKRIKDLDHLESGLDCGGCPVRKATKGQ